MYLPAESETLSPVHQNDRIRSYSRRSVKICLVAQRFDCLGYVALNRPRRDDHKQRACFGPKVPRKRSQFLQTYLPPQRRQSFYQGGTSVRASCTLS